MPPQPTIVETEVEPEINAESFEEKIVPVQEEQIAEATPTAFVKKRPGHQNASSGIIPLYTEESKSAECTSTAVDDKDKETEVQIKDVQIDEITQKVQVQYLARQRHLLQQTKFTI